MKFESENSIDLKIFCLTALILIALIGEYIWWISKVMFLFNLLLLSYECIRGKNNIRRKGA